MTFELFVCRALGFGGGALATASRGETVVAQASASFDTSFDTSFDGSYDSYEEVAGASLSFAALSAAERDEIFAPLGVPLTPAGLASLYDGILPNLFKEGPPLAGPASILPLS